MFKNNYFCLLLTILHCLPLSLVASPVPVREIECSDSGLFNYDNQEHEYKYSSITKLWINDVSEDAESLIKLDGTVLIQRVEPCRYQMKLRNFVVDAPSDTNLSGELEANFASFSIGANGALSSAVKFNPSDKNWVRNVKRAIISSFQLRSESELKSEDVGKSVSNVKSSVIYETDLFGRCRTTYRLRNVNDEIQINKKKALHRCSLDQYRSSPVQGDVYNSVAEYYQGHQYIENYQCEAIVKNGVLNSVSCKHESTYRYSSRGDNGLQAVAQLTLSFVKKNPASSVSPFDRAAPSSIVHDYETETSDDTKFDVDAFASEVCKNTDYGILDSLDVIGANHAKNFRDLISSLKSKSKIDLVNLVNAAKNKCAFGGNVVSSAIVFTETESSVEAVMDLLDGDNFKDAVLQTEYPLLTAVARMRNPSAALISKFKAYLAGKDASFVYLRKSYLIYSTLIKTHCAESDCSSNLDDWTSILVANLGSDCSDSKNKDAVVHALKSIGNIGYIKDKSVLENCAAKKTNSLEVRVSAIQAFRRFSCENTENLDGNYKVLQDTEDDTEVRINAFKSLVRCSNSQKFQTFASKAYSDLLLKDEDYQVISYIIDFAKERGVSVLLNPVLANPEIKQKLQLNFKEFSWNNYRFRYDIQRDAAIEVDTSIIYTPKTFVPRSFNFNLTAHGFGLRLNAVDLQVRLEGLDEILKGLFVDKLSSESLMKRLSENPEQLLDMLKILADKLKFSPEKPYVSFAIRVYGAEVFYIQLDSLEKLKLINTMFGDFKNRLYNKVEFLRSLQLFNSQVKKPLVNGFEFGFDTDVNMAVLNKKDGQREVKGAKTEFKLKNDISISFFLRRHFSVELNQNNKIALRKEVTGILRQKFDMDGHRQEDGVVQYNFNFNPKDTVQLFLLEGKFYKLSKGSNFVEVKNFKIPAKNVERCTSDKFLKNIGLKFCYSINRPEFRKARDIIKSLNDRENDLDILEDDDDFDFDTIDDDDEEDDDNDGDDDADVDRPMVGLAGPFRYEVKVQNPGLINKFVINGKRNINENGKTTEASLSSTSSSGEKRQLDLSYSRFKTVSGRTYKRGASLTLKAPLSNDVRFHFSSQLDYRKKELIDYELKLENKILSDLNFHLHFNRKHKAEGDLASSYKLHAVYDSKVLKSEGTFLHLMFHLNGAKNAIDSEFYVEDKKTKFITAKLALAPNTDSQFDSDYKLSLNGNSFWGSSLELSGPVAYGLLKSNLDVTGKANFALVGIETDLGIKIGHNYDSNGKSYGEFHVSAPGIDIDHGFKSEFEALEKRSSLSMTLNNQKSKASGKPRKIHFERVTESPQSFELGFENFEIDLSERDTSSANFLKKLSPDDPTLRSLNIKINVKSGDNKRIDIDVHVNANDNELISGSYYRFGDINNIRANIDEIPAQKLGLGIKIKTFEYSAGVNGGFGVEVSKSKNLRNLSANLAITGVLQSLLKLSEFSVKSQNEKGKINFNGKIERVGDSYKTIEITATGSPVTMNGDSSEFNFDYVKTFNDGKKSSSKGVSKVTLIDFKNFDVSFSAGKLFEAQASLASKRKDDAQFSYKASLNLVHSDEATPSERKFELDYTKSTDKTESTTFRLDAKSGQPGNLNNEDKLSYILSLNGERVNIKLSSGDVTTISYSDSIKYKSKNTLFDVDSASSVSFDPKAKILKINSKSKSKFPALLEQVKELRFINHDITSTIDLEKKTANIDYNTETDSKVFGRFFRFIKFNYQHKRGVPKLFDASFNADYRRGPTDQNPTPKQRNIKLNLNVDACPGKQCFDVKFGSTVEYRETCQNPSFHFKIDRKGEADNTINSFYNVNIKCGDELITDTKLEYQHEPVKESTRLKRSLSFSSESARYEPKKFELGFSPFTRFSGSANTLVQWSVENNYGAKFNYKRELDEATNSFKSGVSQLSGNVGSKYKKSCSLSVENKGDYLNEFNCVMIVPSSPKELQYGYKFLLVKPVDWYYGGRNIELTANFLSGRVILVQYKGNRATPFDNTDDDNDPNDEREFNATATIFFDHSRDKSKVIVINAKRDNYGPGQFKVFIEARDTPLVRLARLEFDRKYEFNQTLGHLALSYELKNGKSNRFDLKGKLSSDLTESHFQLEANLKRPKFNVLYSNDFDKKNGRLNVLHVRIAELLDFVVDKESDPNNRKISLKYADHAGGPEYKVDAKSNFQNDGYTVEGTLSKGGERLSKISSFFDSMNTNFNVKVDTLVTKKKYELNLGLYDEKTAIGFLKQDDKTVGVASANFVKIDAEKIPMHEIVVNLKWNRFWHAFQENLLGGIQLPSASPSGNLPEGYSFNSYFGDVYAELINDLKPIIDSIKEKRIILTQGLFKELALHLEFYGSVSPTAAKLRQKLIDSQISNKMAPEPELPIYKRLFKRYNDLADRLNNIHDTLYKSRARVLARLVPKLTRIAYNSEDNTSIYQNNVRISKRTSRATNLYQFNAEYRNRILNLGNFFLRVKSSLLRDTQAISFRALLNKYRYRSVRYDYTNVASVFNNRNIIGFGGESESLHTKKRYLLAHDTSKNRFSVILNYEDSPSSILSVYFYGKGPIGISYDKVTLNNKPIALPQEIELSDGKSIYIGRTNNGICAHVDNEVKVCCYEESNSCSVALTRWWNGKVNGLFGKTNNFPQKLKQEDWALDKENLRKAELKPPTENAVRKCYNIFGNYRRSPFRHAFMAVRPNGWKKVCESALTFDEKRNYCRLLKAFAEHSRLEYVDVNVPAECYECQNSQLKKTYKMGERIAAADGTENKVVPGSDYVFLSLPCDSKKYAFNFDGLFKGLNKDKSQSNDVYAIKIDKDETSVYQAENGQFVNFDVKAAGSTLARSSNGEVTEEAFYEAIYYAQTLFARRVASARHLIIISCGNCLPYNAIKVRKLSKALSARNIIVNSWGEYVMSLGDEASDDEIGVGYNKNKLYVYTKDSNEVNEESLSSYKVDHQSDICQRLAVRTYGSVFNINEVRKDFVLKKVPEWFESTRETHTFNVQSCEIVDHRKYADFADFKFTDIVHEEDENDDDNE